MIKKTALTYKYFVLHHQNNYNNPTNVGFFFLNKTTLLLYAVIYFTCICSPWLWWILCLGHPKNKNQVGKRPYFSIYDLCKHFPIDLMVLIAGSSFIS